MARAKSKWAKKIKSGQANSLTQEEKLQVVSDMWNLVRVSRQNAYLLYPLNPEDLERAYKLIKKRWFDA